MVSHILEDPIIVYLDSSIRLLLHYVELRHWILDTVIILLIIDKLINIKELLIISCKVAKIGEFDLCTDR